jgi:hypothetical protein
MKVTYMKSTRNRVRGLGTVTILASLFLGALPLGVAEAQTYTGTGYLGTATIKPAPVNTSEVIDNFDDNKIKGWIFMSSNGQGNLAETNQQLTVSGYWPGIRTVSFWSTWAKGWIPKNWIGRDGETLEWRVDLVGMNEHVSEVRFLIGHWPTLRGYTLVKGRDYVAIGKQESSSIVGLFLEKAPIKNTNIVLVLAMTRADTNMILHARILDKDNANATIYERTVVDTPQIDPTVSSAQFEAVTGQRSLLNNDVKREVLTSGDAVNLEFGQYSDGNSPAAEVTFDNVELRTYEVPMVGIERAIRLTWPASATVDFAVEYAPTVNGPWLPLNEQSSPGFKQMTVPANGDMQFFRLR